VHACQDVEAAEGFLDHFGLRPAGSAGDRVREVATTFGAFPYENLSKLVKKHRVPAGPERRRLPGEVLADHVTLGTGGTCFALTRLFQVVLARLGLESFPVLCDTRHRAANHCALAVVLDGSLGLVDPGYLLHEPLELMPDVGAPRPSALGARLIAVEGSDRLADLYTLGRWRYRVHLDPVSTVRFEAVWDASFDWTMMNGVHLCVRRGSGYVYVHTVKHNSRTIEGGTATNIRGHEAEVLSQQLGLDPGLVTLAYRLVHEARAGNRDAGSTGS
jgi:arylamine N-acetyltransferase